MKNVAVKALHCGISGSLSESETIDLKTLLDTLGTDSQLLIVNTTYWEPATETDNQECLIPIVSHDHYIFLLHNYMYIIISF